MKLQMLIKFLLRWDIKNRYMIIGLPMMVYSSINEFFLS